MDRLPISVFRMHDPYNAHLFEDRARHAELQLIGDDYVPVPRPVFYVPVAQRVIEKTNTSAAITRPNAVLDEKERSRTRTASVVAAQIVSATEILKIARSRADVGDVPGSRALSGVASGMLTQISEMSPGILHSKVVQQALEAVPAEYRNDPDPSSRIIQLAQARNDDHHDHAKSPRERQLMAA